MEYSFLLCPACASLQACKDLSNHGSGGSLRGRGPRVPALSQSGGTVVAEDGLSYALPSPHSLVNTGWIQDTKSVCV